MGREARVTWREEGRMKVGHWPLHVGAAALSSALPRPNGQASPFPRPLSLTPIHLSFSTLLYSTLYRSQASKNVLFPTQLL